MKARGHKRKSSLGRVAHWLFLAFLVAALSSLLFWFSRAYSQDARLTVRVENNQSANQNSPVKIGFSSPMLISSLEKAISVQPSIKFSSSWEGNNQLFIQPNQPLDPNMEYQVKISGAKTRWLVPQSVISFPLKATPPPSLLDVYPKNNQSDVDLYEAIKMEFDQPIGDEYNAQVSIEPQTGFDVLLDQTKKELSILPKEKLSEATLYKLQVVLKNRYYSDYSQNLYTGSFVTKQPAQVTYMTDAAGQPTKTEPIKEEVAPQIKDGNYVDIDLSSQTLRIFENGVQKGVFKVSSGKRGMNTPEGTFNVMSKSKRPWSKKYSLYMPWFIQFTNLGHGIHELPEWPGGYKEGANHLGTPVSHGCVRLGVGPAKKVYDFVDVGTPIVIHQ